MTEEIEAPKTITYNTKLNDLIESKEYKLTLENDTYLLKMESHSNDLISLNVRQINNISFYYFYKEYKYDQLLNLLILNNEYHNNISKIYQFCDIAITKNKVKLIKEKEKMILLLNNIVNFKEVECKLDLNQMKLTNEEMLMILFNEIREIKLKGNIYINTNTNDNKEEKNNKKMEELESKINIIDEKMNLLSEYNKKDKTELESKINIINEKRNVLSEENKKEKKELESKINIINERMNILTEENKKLKNIINKYENFLNERMKEMNKEKELKQKEKEENKNFIKQNININFKDNPQNLKFLEYLTNNHSHSYNICNIDVYIGLKDHIEYLIFNNKSNYNLEIMRIKDKTIITSLKGHNGPTTIIRYYLKDNKEEYILSCDSNKLVIIWDIQNFFNKKYTIQSKYNGYIFDALLLFNIFNNNYILLSSTKDIEYSKLYEFKENTKFIRNIYKTNEHYTCFMIPWLYRNKYYIIDCCDKKISINNLFEDENYAILTMEPEGYHYWGYIFNDNYLCVSDKNNTLIRIWDLVNKVIYKQINLDASSGYGIIPWNNNYAIIGYQSCFAIINIEESKMVKKVTLDNINHIVCTIRKIKTSQLGECLICSDNVGNIILYSL